MTSLSEKWETLIKKITLKPGVDVVIAVLTAFGQKIVEFLCRQVMLCQFLFINSCILSRNCHFSPFCVNTYLLHQNIDT
jgi:hypothetical protein